MPPLRPETRWSATLVQTVSVIATLCAAGWYVRGTYERVITEQRALREEISRLRADLDSRYVTQDQAERYAASFRWENRAANIVVPEPKQFRN